MLSKCGVCWVKMSSAGSVSGGTKDTTPLIRRSGGINSRSSSTSSLYVIRSLAVFSSPAIFPAQNGKSLTCAEEVTANCALLVSLPLFFTVETLFSCLSRCLCSLSLAVMGTHLPSHEAHHPHILTPYASSSSFSILICSPSVLQACSGRK